MITPMTAQMIATTIAALNSWMSMSIMSCFIFYCFAVLRNTNRPTKIWIFLRDDDAFSALNLVFVHRYRKNGLFLRDVIPDYFTRSPYERSVVFTRILSPMLMNRGAMMMAPVSRVTSFCAFVEAVSPLTAGSV